MKASLNYDAKKKEHYLGQFIEIIDSNNSTYGPLALFFLVDNNIILGDEWTTISNYTGGKIDSPDRYIWSQSCPARDSLAFKDP